MSKSTAHLEVLRKHEVGSDAAGAKYYYLAPHWEDSRLYAGKVVQNAQVPGSWQWNTVCSTLAELQSLCKRLEHSEHEGEKSLYKRLTTEILPGIQDGSGKHHEQIQIEADAAADLPGRKVTHLQSGRLFSLSPARLLCHEDHFLCLPFVAIVYTHRPDSA